MDPLGTKGVGSGGAVASIYTRNAAGSHLIWLRAYYLALNGLLWPRGLWPASNAAGQGIQLPFIRIYWAPTLNLEAALVIYTWLGPRMGYIIHDSLRYVDLWLKRMCTHSIWNESVWGNCPPLILSFKRSFWSFVLLYCKALIYCVLLLRHSFMLYVADYLIHLSIFH